MLIPAAERIEAAALAALVRAAPRETVQDLGLGLGALPGATWIRMSGLDILGFNRAFELGVREEFTEAALDAILDDFRAAKIPRCFIQPCPLSRPGAIGAWLEARGILRRDNWIKLHLPQGRLTAARTDLRLERVEPAAAGEFARVVIEGFGMPPRLVPWAASGVGRPGWRHYLAHGEDGPVAGGALFTEGDSAWLGIAATLPCARGRGAQGALIEQRVRDAQELGCHRIFTETAEDAAERDAPSFRNMRRMGFEVLYTRTNYLWQGA